MCFPIYHDKVLVLALACVVTPTTIVKKNFFMMFPPLLTFPSNKQLYFVKFQAYGWTLTFRDHCYQRSMTQIHGVS